MRYACLVEINYQKQVIMVSYNTNNIAYIK